MLFLTPYCWKLFKTWRKQNLYEKRFLLNRDHALTTTLQGALEAYYEQGCEGGFLQAFKPDQRPDECENHFPLILSDDDHLTIYTKADKVLWQGVVFSGRSRLKVPGAPPILQSSWFLRSYRAELTQLPDKPVIRLAAR